jgi:lipopolysaccharide/colanic/teichoic acid biosynthesis glycosyltransferase
VYGLVFKRLLDIVGSALGLLVLSPVLGVFALAIWLQDFRSPLYVAPRVGRGGKTFKMVKLRSMRAEADRSGVDSTSADDRRITAVGRALRAYKLDELSQLWNVLAGDMSLVGPRPNVPREVSLYTDEEQGLLTVRPGITDLASIVFSDEGEILAGLPDPDLAYHQLIRPWKNRLGLLYVQEQSMRGDLELIALTLVAVVSRPLALAGVQRILARIGAPADVSRAALRQAPLTPHAPPGSDCVVTSR